MQIIRILRLLGHGRNISFKVLTKAIMTGELAMSPSPRTLTPSQPFKLQFSALWTSLTTLKNFYIRHWPNPPLEDISSFLPLSLTDLDKLSFKYDMKTVIKKHHNLTTFNKMVTLTQHQMKSMTYISDEYERQQSYQQKHMHQRLQHLDRH